MWRHLLKLYDENRLNDGPPECLFAETQIFNEGWLLRSVLKAWRTSSTRSNVPFLPFPAEARVYSEGQLRTPFKARRRGDPTAETHTRVDGIAGHFSIATDTKSGIALDRGCGYIAAFEAKLYSSIGKGTKNAPGYDQVSRTAACLIHALLEATPAADCAAHLVVLYPADYPDLEPDTYAKAQLRDQIASRLKGYKQAGDATPEIRRFEAGWEERLQQLGVHFQTWEDVLNEIGSESLMQFYGRCQQFNRS